MIPSALSILSPSASSSSFPPLRPRWAPLHTELWLGGIEKYNARMEGYEAITCLEVIEHLDPNVLSRFGVVTMGTYRPRLLLVTTPVSPARSMRSDYIPDSLARTLTSTPNSHGRMTMITVTKALWTRPAERSGCSGQSAASRVMRNS